MKKLGVKIDLEPLMEEADKNRNGRIEYTGKDLKLNLRNLEIQFKIKYEAWKLKVQR